MPFIKLMIIWISLIMMGCAQLKAARAPQPAVEKIAGINTIAIIPFQTIVKETKNRGVVSCPICGNLFRSGEILPNAEKRLANLFYQRLNALEVYRVLPMDQAGGAISKALYDDLKASHLKMAVQVGKELNADAVLAGFVFRYQEREGYAYSVSRPASIAFEVHLISLKEDKSIWEGSFDETQKSLSENVLKLYAFLKIGSKWLTADELAEQAVEDVLKKFPGLRRK
ncbi:MAG: hypothetical protein AB1401_05510 [Thermodesulfobacteriota bacterium]